MAYLVTAGKLTPDGQLVTQCFLFVKISGNFGNTYPMTADEVWSRF